MDPAEPVEARTADDFLLEALGQVGALLTPDENIHQLHFGQTIQHLLQQDFAQEPRSASDQHPLPLVVLL